MVKNLPANEGYARDTGSVLGSWISPEGGHSNLFQYTCLKNPWTEKLAGYNLWGHKNRTQLKRLSTAQEHIYSVQVYIESGHKILPQADDYDSGHQKEAQPRSLGFIKAITHG